MQRDVMNYDVIIIGAGPAGLATAIKLRQLALTQQHELSICILEKGSEIGAHILSGCVIDPISLTELIPNWRELGFPLNNHVSHESSLFLTKSKAYKFPMPREWQNHGNYIISLSQLCRSLANYAESIGIEIYAGFSASTPIVENGQLRGVITGDMGVSKNLTPKVGFTPGMEIRAQQTVIAEGCRGSFARQITNLFQLDSNSTPQTYGLGIKEIWRVQPELHQLGKIIHSLGYPLYNQAYGGGFIYHMEDNLVAIGLVTALDYHNPYLSPYEEFQKFKNHPKVAKLLHNAQRIEYGARSVSEGGLQALPRLSFPGGAIVGDSAGFLNVPKIKGVHNAMKSGMLAAQAIFTAILNHEDEAHTYWQLFKDSWLHTELYHVRNIRPSFRYGGLYGGIVYTILDKYILRGHAPWTFKIRKPDHLRTRTLEQAGPITYSPPDRKITFDKSSSIHLAGIVHDDDQPTHLKLKHPDRAITINLAKFGAPETRYCPAGVYEIIEHNGKHELIINAQNCVHCKACDIKDPTQNITWTPPEGGCGPQYSEM